MNPLFSFLTSMLMTAPTSQSLPPPIVYTIAGSDSGGGAGIQADLHAIHSFGCHGCSAITCLTAQNSVGVTGVHAPPTSFLKQQLDTLLEDLPPQAIKIGMLGSKELAECVGSFLENVTTSTSNPPPWIVLDPVMISTSGHKLINDDAVEAMKRYIFPLTDVLTPNKYEAEFLLNRKLTTPQNVEEGARELLNMGVKSVLIKGGHSLDEGNEDGGDSSGFAQDYFLSSIPREDGGEERLCDGTRGVWLCTNRYVNYMVTALLVVLICVPVIHSCLASFNKGLTRNTLMELDAHCHPQSHRHLLLVNNGDKSQIQILRVPLVPFIQSMRVAWQKPTLLQELREDKEYVLVIVV